MVPVVDLTRSGLERADRFALLAHDVCASGQYLLGPQTHAFEAEFGAWLAAEHVVAVGSGAGALQLAMAAMEIGVGDEVLVPAFTAVPTASAVCAVGATPVFVDVDPATGTLATAAVEQARTDRTRAVIVVHLYGRPADLPATDLAIIEDAAQAHGAVRRHDRSAAVAYSFYPTKNLGGIGDGGAVVTADADLAERVRRLRVHGMSAEYVHDDISQNSRMAEVEAGWLRLALADLRGDNARRQAITQHYRDAAPHLRWQAPHQDHVYHLCVFRAADRHAAQQSLSDSGVATGVHYPLALTQQPAFVKLSTTPCPQAEQWANECVTVPCFPQLSDAEVELVATALASVQS